MTRRQLAVSLVVVLVSVCQSLHAAQATRPLLTRGAIVSGVYTNPYFGMEVSLPEGWLSVTDEEILSMDDKTIKPVIEEIRRGTPLTALPAIPLMFAVNMTDVKPQQGPANVVVFAESLGPGGGPLSMLAYVESLRRQQLALHPNQSMPLELEQVGNRTFRTFLFFQRHPRGVLKQQFYCAESNGYALCFVATYLTEAQNDAVRSLVQNVRFPTARQTSR